MSKPKLDDKTECPECRASAVKMMTDSAFVSWCENGHVCVDDFNALVGFKMVHDFHTLPR